MKISQFQFYVSAVYVFGETLNIEQLDDLETNEC